MSAAASSLRDPPPPPLDQIVEAARLRALHTYRTLDPAWLDRLGGVAVQAADALKAAAAAISIVDVHQMWLLGASGLPRHEYPRESSFCDAVVRSQRPLLVPDAVGDPRFWHHPLVQRHGIRAYAGAPLVDDGGYALGAIAVMDPQPRTFAPAVLDDLTSLSRLVVTFLAERRAARQFEAPAVGSAWLGVRTLGSRQPGPDITPGLVVLSVARGSPAAAVGLRPMDILLAVDGQLLRHRDDLARALAASGPGASIRLRYRRAGQSVDATILLTAAPRTRR